MDKTTYLSELIKKKYDQLTKTQHKIADYFLRNEDEISFLTIDVLATQIGVSPSSLTRFSTEIGFRGYPGLQKALRKDLQNKLNPVHRLSSEISSDKNDIVKKSFQKDSSNLQETMRLNSQEIINSVVELIQHSRNIYIIGHRTSYSIASYMHAILEPILGNVVLVNTIERMNTELLLRMNQDDVLISINFPRYHKETVEFTEMAKSQKIKIIALTDSMASPLIKYSDSYLLSKYESANFHNSNVSALAIINSIAASLAVRLEDQVKTRLNKIEELNRKNSNNINTDYQ